MKRQAALWLVFGAFAASAALNIYHARGAPGPDETGPELKAPQARKVARQPGPGPKFPNQKAPCGVRIDTLKLTPAQKRQFSDGCPSYTERCGQLCQLIEKVTAELERELCAQKPDRQRISRLADRIGKLRADELENRISTILLVRKTLTPSQLERLRNCCGQE